MQQQIDHCPLCGNDALSRSATAPGFQDGNTYGIYSCNRCCSSFALPMQVDDHIYDLIYKEIQFVPGYNRYHSYAHTITRHKNPLQFLSYQEESYWAVANRLINRQKTCNNLSILEVGCGLGYFSYALKQHGFNITGVDLSPKAVSWARENYGSYFECVTLQTLREKGLRYDAIIMNQLIEHIPDVHEFIDMALSLLSPDGELLITTPNKTAYPDGEWETELPPIHLWWFAEESMKFIAKQHECEIEFIDFTAFYAERAFRKPLSTPICERQSVFDESGNLVLRQILPKKASWRIILDQVGLTNRLRKSKFHLLKIETWAGAHGPICACTLRPTRKLHD